VAQLQYPLASHYEAREYAERDLGDPIMDFRLTYQGPLLAERDDPKRRIHKHAIRKAFHVQLNELWHTHPALKFRTTIPVQFFDTSTQQTYTTTRLGVLASRYARHGVNWAPLINAEVFGTACSLSVLFLRPEAKGGIVKTGDLDNRVKLLFDALTIPQENELPTGFDPKTEADPFCCLLSDDSLITHFTVTADRLLVPNQESTTAHLIIEVKTMLTDHDKGYIEFS
jgi:hypothetical protein